MTEKPKALTAAPNEPSYHDAAFVAMLLRVLPDTVFARSPDISEEGNQHLVETVALTVGDLAANLDHDNDGTEAFAAYRGRVLLCEGVMAGRLSAPPRSRWDQLAIEYGRGVYLSHKAHARGRVRP
jgi:hypothetical protein